MKMSPCQQVGSTLYAQYQGGNLSFVIMTTDVSDRIGFTIGKTPGRGWRDASMTTHGYIVTV
jgi:hypothetical protein